MLQGQKIVVVMPAYNAARTLRQTYDEVMAHGIVDRIILVDDASKDETAAMARRLPLVQVEVHPRNRGYGGNQKTCYRLALAAGADIVIMIHPDYQYTPALIPAMAALVASGLYPCVLASRILGGGARRGGMPWWKYVSNRLLTLMENLLLGAKLSEYHSGYRAFARSLLERLPLEENSDDFLFDNQILAQVIGLGYPSGKSAARPGIFRKPLRSVFAPACVMDWVASGRHFAIAALRRGGTFDMATLLRLHCVQIEDEQEHTRAPRADAPAPPRRQPFRGSNPKLADSRYLSRPGCHHLDRLWSNARL